MAATAAWGNGSAAGNVSLDATGFGYATATSAGSLALVAQLAAQARTEALAVLTLSGDAMAVRPAPAVSVAGSTPSAGSSAVETVSAGGHADARQITSSTGTHVQIGSSDGGETA